MKHIINPARKQESHVIYGNFEKRLPDKKPFNRLTSSDWKKIRRANNPEKGLSEKAQNLLSAFIYFINKDGVAICDHEDLTEITDCKYVQNNNLLSQLTDIVDIKFHRAIKIANRKKKSYNTFIITFTQNGQSILENPKAYYTESYVKNFQKNITECSKNQASTLEKLSEHTRKIKPTKLIYSKDIILEEEPLGYSSSKIIDKDLDISDKEKTRARENETDDPKNEKSESGFKILDQEIPQETIPEIEPKIIAPEIPTLASSPVQQVSESSFKNNFSDSVPVETSSTGNKTPVQSNSIQILKDFYPLNEDDGKRLKESSKRNFTLNAMNQILLDISKKYGEKSFNGKRAFFAYMSKVLMNEKRPEGMLNQEGFILRNNMSEEDRYREEQEEYLSKILLDRDISIDSQIKKSIADREVLSESLSRNTACNVLKAYKSYRIAKDGTIALNFRFHVDLTEREREIIMNKLIIVSMGMGRTTEIEFSAEPTAIINVIGNMLDNTKVKITDFTKLTPDISDKMTQTTSTAYLRSSVWQSLTQDLIKTFNGHDFRFEGIFSKFTVDVDERTKTITLKTSSDLYHDLLRDKIGHYFRYCPPTDCQGEDKWVLYQRELYQKYPYAIKIAFISESQINARTEVKQPSSYVPLTAPQDSSVEPNMKLLELSNLMRESIESSDLILSSCEFTEINSQKINIEVKKEVALDEKLKVEIKECIRRVYGDDVKVVTKN
jgi:hypothetical protein